MRFYPNLWMAAGRLWWPLCSLCLCAQNTDERCDGTQRWGGVLKAEERKRALTDWLEGTFLSHSAGCFKSCFLWMALKWRTDFISIGTLRSSPTFTLETLMNCRMSVLRDRVAYPSAVVSVVPAVMTARAAHGTQSHNGIQFSSVQFNSIQFR